MDIRLARSIDGSRRRGLDFIFALGLRGQKEPPHVRGRLYQRRHANWSQKIADATPDRGDAEVLRDRARRLSEMADRFERREDESSSPGPSKPSLTPLVAV